MLLTLEAMGKPLNATLDFDDVRVRVSFLLPGMLGFMADAIAAGVRHEGSRLLLGKG
jgi:hypothetical protein